MSTHTATITWKRTTDDFAFENYNREHQWAFPNGQSLRASSAPEYLGDADCVDPEEGLVASLSSCHMLTFLAIAAKKRYTVDSYVDNPTALLDKNEEGAMAITRIELHPVVRFSGDKLPDAEELDRIHASAHKHCFIANSIRAEVVVMT